jgi:hypothetical protein
MTDMEQGLGRPIDSADVNHKQPAPPTLQVLEAPAGTQIAAGGSPLASDHLLGT